VAERPPSTRKVSTSVDPDVCVGNASCVAIVPDVFALDDNMQSTVVNADGAPWEQILDAAENCPVSAITVVDAETGERLFP